jgi:hypothetical protein
MMPHCHRWALIFSLSLLWLAACGLSPTAPVLTTTPAPNGTATAAARRFDTQVAATGTALHLTAEITPGPASTAASPPAVGSPTLVETATAMLTPLAAPASSTPTFPTAVLPTQATAPTISSVPCTEGVCVTFSPNPADPEGAVTLSWNAPQASQVTILWSGLNAAAQLPNLPAAGTHTFDLTQISFTGTLAHFHFDAYNPAGERIAYNSIDIPLQNRLAFKAVAFSPTQVAPGEAVTLTWEVAGADHLTLTKLDVLGRLTNESQALPLSGSLMLQTDPAYRNAMQFMLLASSGRVYLSQIITVKLTCPDTWFFPNPPALCPAPASYLPLVEQSFQHGLMIWGTLSGGSYIYVFYDTNDGERFADAWQAGMTESDPTLTPPAGLYQPVRGFGQIWREATSARHASPVRDLLGWAIAPEFSLNGAFQCDSRPHYGDCYIGAPDGAIYVAGYSSGFHRWTGPTP